jgi:hypothetical protein
MVCGVLLAGVLITWLVVPGPGYTISLDGFRSLIETAASRALGGEVHIDGKLVLRPTMGPVIEAHDVRFTSHAGQGDLLRAGRATVRLASAALLQGKPRGMRLLIEDASIDLDARGAVAPGANVAGSGDTNAGVYPRLLSTCAALLVRQPELQELRLHRVVLNYRDDHTEQARQARLDEISLHARPGQALELTVQGRFQQQPYTIGLSGGRLEDLLTPTGPWPLRAEVIYADARLLLNGNLEVSRQGLAIPFDLQVDWPAEFARLAARLGQAPLAGQLSLRTDRGRPVVAGELQLPALDAVLQFGAGAGPARDTVGQAGPDGGILANRPVRVPLTVSIADVPFHGQLSMAGEGAETVAELVLSATDAHADRLLAMLTGITGIRGRSRHIRFQAGVRGSGETDIVNRMALALQVDGARLSYGNTAGERSVAVSLDELALTLPAGEAVKLRARGSLLDESFSVAFTADRLEALLVDERWPMTLSATGSGAVLDISDPLGAVHSTTATRLHVGLYGERLGDLATWLGVSPCAEASYKLRGQLVLAEDIGRLQFLQGQTDRTRLTGELDWSGDDQIALLHAVLNFDALDPADIEALMPLVNQGPDEGVARGIAIDIPVLPGRVEIVNADIDLAIAQVLLEPVDITEVSLSARIRAGQLQRSPFHTHIGYVSFQGYLDPTIAETGVIFENEDADNAAGGRLDKLFSSAVRWVGNTAIVPMRWIFRKKFPAGDSSGCQVQEVKAGN